MTIYILDIHYYIYEESEIIYRILAMGSQVKVLHPSTIAQEIYKRAKQAVKEYSKVISSTEKR